MRERRAQHGGSTFSTLLWIVGLVAVGYFGVLFVPPYFDNFGVKQVLREAANKAISNPNDDVIREHIRTKCKQIGSHTEIVDGQERTIPGIVLLDDNIFVNRDDYAKTIIVQVDYEVTVDFPVIKRQHTIRFSPSVKGDLTPVKW